MTEAPKRASDVHQYLSPPDFPMTYADARLMMEEAARNPDKYVRADDHAALREAADKLAEALKIAEYKLIGLQNMLLDEDYVGKVDGLTVPAVCHVLPYWKIQMKHLEDAIAEVAAALAAHKEATE